MSSREKLEKFIRELHRLTTYAKTTEFYFLSALLTPNRRNYADYQSIQEGNTIPESERLAVMGMQINKTTLPEDIKQKMQDILVEEILTADNIDQVNIMKKLIILEKDIFNSIMNKETKYYKPDNIASINSYSKNPYEVNGIVAAMIYNALRDDDMPATQDGKTWRCQFYYEDWQGVRHKKNKRGFKTKAEAEEGERNFRQQQRKDLDINFENFVEIYFSDVEKRLRESTIKNKRKVLITSWQHFSIMRSDIMT